MKNKFFLVIITAVFFCCVGCSQEKSNKDRGQASDMFARICSLTKEYTTLLSQASDSLSWAETCSDFEEKLDKISFSYPPDTDILLTEGQNDTIYSLMQEYIKIREARINDIMYPKVETDSLYVSDSLPVIDKEGQSISD